MKIRFMCLFSLCLYIFAQIVDLNCNPHYLKKGQTITRFSKDMVVKKFSSSVPKSIIMYS